MTKDRTTVDENPELILEEDFRIRRSFDPHISSISLRPMTNNPSEGYKLAVSANFGSERVKIPIQGENIEFKFEIFKAEVVLDVAQCKFDPLFKYDASISDPIFAEERPQPDERDRKTRFKVDTGKLLEQVTGGGKVEVEHSIEGKRPNVHKAWFEVSFLNDHTIQIVSRGEEPVPLDGRLLNEFIGWRVLPIQRGDSGVVARVRVREDWIRLTDPRQKDGKGVLLKRLLELVQSDSDELEARRNAFHILMTHLAAKGLQRMSETTSATLAFDTVIVRPLEERLERVQNYNEASMLEIEGTAVSRLLKSKLGDERKVLIDAGVPDSRLPPEGEKNDIAKESANRLQIHEIVLNYVNYVIRKDVIVNNYSIREISNFTLKTILEENFEVSKELVDYKFSKTDFYVSTHDVFDIFSIFNEVDIKNIIKQASYQINGSIYVDVIALIKIIIGAEYYDSYKEIYADEVIKIVRSSRIRAVIIK